MNKRQAHRTKKPTDYYDSIAHLYDKKMDAALVHEIRGYIKGYLKTISGLELILDFGAGTGNDLVWQLENGYKLTFYEPSAKMAAIANEKHQIEADPRIECLIGDYATLGKLKHLKSQKYDAVFSNFAALNSVKDLAEVFELISELLREKGHFLCLLYDRQGKLGKLKSYFLHTERTKVNHVSSDNSDKSMPVYLHTRKQIISLAEKQGMHITLEKNFNSYGFRWYHFVKKT